MGKAERKFWLDVMLIVLLGLNVVSLIGGHPHGQQAMHHATGMLLIVGVTIHLIWNWNWIKTNILRSPVATGQAGGARQRLGILFIGLFVLCSASGLRLELMERVPLAHHFFLLEEGWEHLHSLSGTVMILLMVPHLRHNAKWLAHMARRCFTRKSLAPSLAKSASDKGLSE